MSRRRTRQAGEPVVERGARDAPPDRKTAGERVGPLGTAQQEIARRAYEMYLERGGGPGRDLEDWLRAECEVGGHDK
jgi:hypothetical protein